MPIPAQYSGRSYTGYTQGFAPASVWIVNHNLGRRAVVTVLNNAGEQLDVYVRHMSVNQARVEFDVPVAGIVVVK